MQAENPINAIDNSFNSEAMYTLILFEDSHHPQDVHIPKASENAFPEHTPQFHYLHLITQVLHVHP
jgi:hypothetical protein